MVISYFSVDQLIKRTDWLFQQVQLSLVLSITFLIVLPLPYHHGNQSCVTASDIMTEVNASSPDQSQEVGAVLGRVLYHALQGHCFISRSLPEESFFLDYIMDHLGSENFTVGGNCPSETHKNTDTDTRIDRDSSLRNPELVSVGNEVLGKVFLSFNKSFQLGLLSTLATRKTAESCSCFA